MLTCGAWSCLQYGRTAMMWAAHNGHVEVVDRLLAAGADKDAKNKVPGCV
jgi:ankyrin repeat protein